MHEVVDQAREGREAATTVHRSHRSGPEPEKSSGDETGINRVLHVRFAAVTFHDALRTRKPEMKIIITACFRLKLPFNDLFISLIRWCS